MKMPRRFAQAVSAPLVAHMLVAPAAQALGPLTPVHLTITRAAARLDEREGTIDFPVTFQNKTKQAIAGPIHVQTFGGLKNATTYDGANTYLTLPTGLAPGQSVTQIFRFDAPSRLDTPPFTTFVETIQPVDPAPAPAVANARPGESVVNSDYGLRIRARVGEEYVWDADATNPNGGTLRFSLGPIPYPTPDLVAATFLDTATLDPVTGVFRWTPPTAGLYTARLSISDGTVNTPGYDFAFQVEADAQPPLTCHDYATQIASPGDETTIHWTMFRYIGLGALPNVDPAPGRTAKCSLEPDALLGAGTHPVHCETNDGLWPVASCQFDVVVTPTYPIVVIDHLQDYVNLRLTSPGCSDLTNLVTPCRGVGYGKVVIRNTALGTAHFVTLTIPYPPEANRDTQIIRTGVDTQCERNGLVDDSPLVCHLGHLASGGEIDVEVAYAPVSILPYFSPVTATVSTDDPELSIVDNTVSFQASSALSGSLALPELYCGETCQEFKKKAALAACRKHQPNVAFGALLGDRCEGTPEWFQDVALGLFAVGALVTGIGAVAIAEFGAIDSVVFTAQEAGGFIR